VNIAVLGAGNWGTTAALLLAGNGHRVRLWEFNNALAQTMIDTRENRTYLPGYCIPDSVLVTNDLAEALDGAGMAAFVVPSTVTRTTAKAVAATGVLADDAVLVSLSKGLEYRTLNTLTVEIAEELPHHATVALSGPCIASEVAAGMPTTIVAASGNKDAAHLVQDAFMTPVFRVYTSDDPNGVQLGGALKNIIAIAAGICDGLGFGTNAKSALMTRGIVEMTRFGMLRGARAETFNGLSGIGDLMTTCMSTHSRNRRVGEELVLGKTLEDILNGMVMVAEGVPTTRAVYDFSKEHGIDMPITAQVYGVLFEGFPPDRAVRELMLRERKPE
jgi:glycerol-3-phosphate dehydrogenase (NAD(P)+)